MFCHFICFLLLLEVSWGEGEGIGRQCYKNMRHLLIMPRNISQGAKGIARPCRVVRFDSFYDA